MSSIDNLFWGELITYSQLRRTRNERIFGRYVEHIVKFPIDDGKPGA